MTPLFKHLCQSCNMNVEQAAEFLDIRHTTAFEMWSGQRDPADGIIIEMKNKILQIHLDAERSISKGLHINQDDAIQQRIIELMSTQDVLLYFGRTEFKDIVTEPYDKIRGI